MGNIIYISAVFLSPNRINKIFKAHLCQYRGFICYNKIACNAFI